MDIKKIKLIAIDMDGTTFLHHAGLAKGTLETVNKLQKAGYHIVFLTGRTFFDCYNQTSVFNIHQFSGYISILNGASIVKITKDGYEEVYKNWINKTDVKNIFDIGKKHNLDIWCNTDNHRLAVSNFDSSNFIERNCNDLAKIKTIFKDLPKDDNFNYNAYKLVILNNKKSKDSYNELFEYIKKHDLTTTEGVAPVWEIQAKDTSKGTALEKITKIFNLKKENVASIGDGFNDLPMFKASAISIAMKNSEERVKKAANFVTDESYLNGGASKFLEKMFLNKVNN